MKKYFMLIVTVIATSLIFWSCGSDDGTTEPTNQSPTCTIASPAPYTGFFNGDTISVRISVDDPDGDIKEVRYFLNGLGEYSTQTFPYSAEILTSGLPLGANLIKVVVEDDDGAKTEVELPFGIKPKNPSNLLITQNNVYTFTLNWTGNDENADGFKIERKIDDGSFSEISTTTATTYIDSTVAKKGYGTVYYQVRAYKDIYNSDYVSNNFAVSFPAPTNLTYTKINLNTIRLNWLESSNGEDGFKIDKKVGNNDWTIEYGSVIENTVSWTDSLAEINENLQYRIYGYKGLNTSESVVTAAINNNINAPYNFTIIQNNVHTFTLNWTDNNIGEDGFKIERKIDDGTFTEIATITETNYVDDTVAKKGYGTVYYQVRAYKEIYNSAYSVQSASVIFPAPTNLTFTKENLNTIRLNWTDNSSGEDGFIVDKKIGTGEWAIGFASLGSNTTTWTDNYAEINQSLTYRIHAYKGTNSSATVSTSSIDNTFPAPTGFAVTQTSISSATVEWKDNSIGEEKFEIERKLSTDTEYTKITEIAGSDTVSKSWLDSTVMPSQTYDYRIRAVKGTDSSVYVLRSDFNNLFQAPSELTLTQDNVYTFTLNWVDNSTGEEGFIIERKIDDGAYTEIAILEANAVTYTDETVSKKGYGTVFYQIRAYKDTTYSEYITSNTVINFPAPTNLILTHTSLTSVSLSWTDNSIGEDMFEIERKLLSESDYVKIGEVIGSDTTTKYFDDNTVAPLQTYDYRVVAVKDSNSSDSILITFVNRLPVPTNLVLSAESSTVFKLYWEDNTNFEDGFKIDKKIGDYGTWSIDYASVGSNITSYSDTGLSLGTTYYYRIRAYYQEYYSEYSEVMSQTCNIIEVPSGSFNMGDLDAYNATPVHTVNITRPFYLGKYEVTQKEWENIMGYNPADNSGIGDFFPIYRINWYEIMVYCNKRSILEKLTPCYSINGTTDPQYWGPIPTEADSVWDAVACDFTAQGYRLPTEAEWEYAARYNDSRTYPWGDTEPSETLCNYDGNVGTTTVVGSYPAGNSSLGFCDMAGNVHEWIWDSYDSHYYQYCVDNNIVDDPTGTTRSITRVLRGGSLGVNSNILSAYRSWLFADGDEAYVVGFRVARTK